MRSDLRPEGLFVPPEPMTTFLRLSSGCFVYKPCSRNTTAAMCTAEVTLGTRTFMLGKNQSVDIPVGTLHRLYNPGAAPLELIELQSGDYLGEEDDIVRFDDVDGRSVTALAPATVASIGAS